MFEEAVMAVLVIEQVTSAPAVIGTVLSLRGIVTQWAGLHLAHIARGLHFG